MSPCVNGISITSFTSRILLKIGEAQEGANISIDRGSLLFFNNFSNVWDMTASPTQDGPTINNFIYKIYSTRVCQLTFVFLAPLT